jgi:hypothetical protein
MQRNKSKKTAAKTKQINFSKGRINGVQRELTVTFYQRRAIDRAQWEQMAGKLGALVCFHKNTKKYKKKL